MSLWFSDLDGENRALDLTGSTEDAIFLACGVSFLLGQECLSTQVRVHRSRGLQPIEDVYWADAYADAIGYAYVEVDCDFCAVDSQLLVCVVNVS